MRLYLHPTSHQLMSETLTKQCKINPADCEWIETNAAPAKRVAREWLIYSSRTEGWVGMEYKPGAVLNQTKNFIHVREVLPDEI